ncbi:TetR/AcrR family transcriptional regulator [Frigoribacterium sp. 2-23]|uniref:TetR/AcrR family transcriptional regulator n=1 Tax=Frigoribacterium sp. 2-23 TaxID=3415006 RepID=UPI003C6FAE74
MTGQPFHHGNLRAVLLEQAEVMLREGGLDGLSLRELARQAGVSHGAPRSHFVDRQALLDALAERGFARLTEEVRVALRGRAPLRTRFGRVAQAYVGFAIDDAALMELMFAAKTSERPGPARDAAEGLFGVLDEAMGPADADDSAGSRDQFKLMFGATMQGIAALVASRRISRPQGEALVDEATDMLLESRLGARAVSRR